MLVVIARVLLITADEKRCKTQLPQIKCVLSQAIDPHIGEAAVQCLNLRIHVTNATKVRVLAQNSLASAHNVDMR